MRIRELLNHGTYSEAKAPKTGFISLTKLLLMLNHVRLYSHRIKSRKALANLSSEQLKDIGLNKAAARAEAEKPFWR